MELDEWIEQVMDGDIAPDMGEKVQLYQKDGRWRLRKAPRTIEDPTPAQIEHRLRFAEVMERARGLTRTGELPPGAELVRRQMSTGRKPRPRSTAVTDILQRYIREQEIEISIDELVQRLEEMMA